MARKVLNIVVGTRLTKVCCTSPKRRGIRVLDNFMFPTPAGAVSDGIIEDPELLSSELTEQLKKHKLGKIKRVIFSISSSKIASREVYLPLMKDKQVGQTIATNASDYFPVDLSKYQITHTVLERIKNAEPKLRVLVLAAPLYMLEGYFELAKLCKLEITSIDSSGNSDYRALIALPDEKVTMYIDVDCSTSYVSFIQGKTLLLQRTFAFGGDMLIDNYMARNEIPATDFLETIQILSQGSPEYIGDEAIEQYELESDLDRLVNSISRSVDFFNSSRHTDAAQQIVLLGTCGRLAGLRELVEKDSGLPTVYLDDIHNLSAMTHAKGSAAAYINSIGSGISPLDFMPSSLTGRGASTPANREPSLAFGVISLILLLLGSASLVALSVMQYQAEEAKLTALRQEISDLEYTEPIYLSYEAHMGSELQLTEINQFYSMPNSQLSAFYSELEKKMPKEILILSASCTNGGVTMNVTVPGFDEAAVVIKQFRSFESISDIQVSDISLGTNEIGTETASFSINCIYGTNPYKNDLNPYSNLFTTDQIGPPDTASDSNRETEAVQ